MHMADENKQHIQLFDIKRWIELNWMGSKSLKSQLAIRPCVYTTSVSASLTTISCTTKTINKLNCNPSILDNVIQLWTIVGCYHWPACVRNALVWIAIYRRWCSHTLAFYTIIESSGIDCDQRLNQFRLSPSLSLSVILFHPVFPLTFIHSIELAKVE